MTRTRCAAAQEHIVVATGSDHADAVRAGFAIVASPSRHHTPSHPIITSPLISHHQVRSDSVIVASLKYVNLHSEVAVEEADVEDLQLVAVGENNIVLVSSEVLTWSYSPVLWHY